MTKNPPTAANPPDGGEPADLSDLTATDALLDRLGARRAADEDLFDPTVAGLIELLAVVDETRDPDTGLARLIEVLDGRPLYVAAPAQQQADLLNLDQDAVLELIGIDLAPARSRIIDLTDNALDSPVRSIGPADLAGSADLADSADSADSAELAPVVDAADPAAASGSDDPAGSADPAEAVDSDDPADSDELTSPIEIPAARTLTGSTSTAATLIPIQAAGRRWERALSQISLPAASVLLLLAVTGGVSAVVTGDPMTPVNGVSRVMAQLPGVGDTESSLSHVQGEITAANVAVRHNDASSANRHLAAARRGLTDVPDDQKQKLTVMIASVQTMLASPLVTSPVVPAPPIGVEATSPAVASTASPSTGASPQPTVVVVPTTPPSSTPAPSDEPSTPVTVPDSSPPTVPTPVATASGS